MKRRRFVHSLLVAPAVPAVVNAQQTRPQEQPQPQPNTPARQVPQQPPTQTTKLAKIEEDVVAETDQRYFSNDQFSALAKLGTILMPPLKGNPGAVEAHAPEFLDFLLS